MKRHEEGITLIALIVTIVILIILTAITIGNVMGSDLFGLAKRATENYIQAGKEEESAIDDLIYEVEDMQGIAKGNYSIRKNGKKEWYDTLQEAYDNAVDNGGDNNGGTIKIEKDVKEEVSAITITKTITIDTNGKTMERNSSIITTAGTLTIVGNGKIYCNTDTPTITRQGRQHRDRRKSNNRRNS